MSDAPVAFLEQEDGGWVVFCVEFDPASGDYVETEEIGWFDCLDAAAAAFSAACGGVGGMTAHQFRHLYQIEKEGRPEQNLSKPFMSRKDVRRLIRTAVNTCLRAADLADVEIEDGAAVAAFNDMMCHGWLWPRRRLDEGSLRVDARRHVSIHYWPEQH